MKIDADKLIATLSKHKTQAEAVEASEHYIAALDHAITVIEQEKMYAESAERIGLGQEADDE